MLDDQPPALRWLLPRLSVPSELHPDLVDRLAGPNGQRLLATLARATASSNAPWVPRRRAHAPPDPRPAVRRAALPAPATAHLPGAPPRDRVAAPNLSPREREVLHQLAGRHSTTPTDDRPVPALRCASRQVLPTGPGLRGCAAAAALVLTSMLRDRVRAEHRPQMLA